MHFSDLELLLLLVLLPLLFLYQRWQSRRRSAALIYSDLNRWTKAPATWRTRFRGLPTILHFTALALLVVALGRPQSYETVLETDYTEGVDILIALDCSSSMQAMDLDYKKRTRLEVAKEVTRDFISKRKGDRIGLVVFAGDAYTQCPMTLDYGVLVDLLDNVSITMNGTIPDKTAIGLATARCLKRLENSEGKSRIVILLTDGMNNAGEVEPLQAAQLAEALDVKLYTIGTGSKSGLAPVLQEHPFFGNSWQNVRVQLDERTLTGMAKKTGGRYFRAGDEEELKNIFTEIDRLEKTEFEALGEHRFTELFPSLVWLAVLLLLAEMVLTETWLRRLP